MNHVQKKEEAPAPLKWWLPLPFHPLWEQAGIAAAVRRASAEPGNRNLVERAFADSKVVVADVCMVAWKSTIKPAAIVVRRRLLRGLHEQRGP